MPELLPFRLPDFTRIIWVSDKAKEVWEPKISAITSLWASIERDPRSASTPLPRRASLTSIDPARLADDVSYAIDKGLVVTPLAAEAAGGVYSASARSPRPGEAINIRVVTTLSAVDGSLFQRYWRDGNDFEIGLMLGYPDCCRYFFNNTWKEGSVDPTLYMKPGTRINPLLRWIGVRPVFHMPCSCDCEPSYRTFTALRKAMWDANQYITKDWLHLLDMPVEYSSLHGIAIIRTPIFSIHTRADATKDKFIMQYVAQEPFYPNESATGTTFPYQQPKGLAITESPSFKESLGHEWSDNGFGSKTSMDEAHGDIINLMTRAVDLATEAKTFDFIVDFGAGNGVLLKRFHEYFPAAKLVGVELDKEKCGRAGTAPVQMLNVDIFKSDFTEDLVVEYHKSLAIISVARFKNAGEIRRLIAHLQWFDRVLFYAYDDTMKEFASLMWENMGHVPHRIVAQESTSRIRAVLIQFTK